MAQASPEGSAPLGPLATGRPWRQPAPGSCRVSVCQTRAQNIIRSDPLTSWPRGAHSCTWPSGSLSPVAVAVSGYVLNVNSCMNFLDLPGCFCWFV